MDAIQTSGRNASSFPLWLKGILSALPVISLLSASGPAAAAETIVLTGSSTVAPLASEIGKRFETTRPGVRVDVQSGGSSRGVRDARNGLADIGRRQIIDIYTGKIRDWSGVGAGSGTIVIENKAEGRSTLDLFLSYFGLNAPDIRADVVVGDNQEAIKVVSGNPLAIGGGTGAAGPPPSRPDEVPA
jgi:phosphate transport system substrate-binding protein